LLTMLDKLAQGTLQPEKQQAALANYARNLSKEEALIDWQLPAAQLERCIRAFNPWPFSYLVIQEQNVKIWQAQVLAESHTAIPGTVLRTGKEGIDVATAEGVLRLLRLQPPGKKPMQAHELLNSRQDWFVPGQPLR